MFTKHMLLHFRSNYLTHVLMLHKRDINNDEVLIILFQQTLANFPQLSSVHTRSKWRCVRNFIVEKIFPTNVLTLWTAHHKHRAEGSLLRSLLEQQHERHENCIGVLDDRVQMLRDRCDDASWVRGIYGYFGTFCSEPVRSRVNSIYYTF